MAESFPATDKGHENHTFQILISGNKSYGFGLKVLLGPCETSMADNPRYITEYSFGLFWKNQPWGSQLTCDHDWNDYSKRSGIFCLRCDLHI
jgi:hypothetical protein